MVSSHREAAHILGLRNYPSFFSPASEGNSSSAARMSLRRRYHELTHGNQLNIRSLERTSIKSLRQSIQRMVHGDSMSFTAYWLYFNPIEWEDFLTGHCVSLHMICDQGRIHFIYVNRGESPVPEWQPNVLIFTKDKEDAELFAKKIAVAFKSGKTSVATFLHQSAGEVNRELTQLIIKKDQKVGNCSIANGNFSWFVDLVGRKMKSFPLISFQQCIIDCKPEYRKIRITDRILAIEWMVQHRSDYRSDKVFMYNYLQSLTHLGRKGPFAMAKLVLHMEERGMLHHLLAPLLRDDFKRVLDEYADAVIAKSHKRVVDLHERRRKRKVEFQESALDPLFRYAIPELTEEEQNKLVAHDITMMRYVNKEIQCSLLERNRNLLVLAAPDLISSFLKTTGLYSANEKNLLRTILQYDPEFIENYLLVTVLNEVPNQIKNNSMAMNTLHLFRTSLVFRDREKMIKHLDDLCLICAKEGRSKVKTSYSKETLLMRWLSTHISEYIEIPGHPLLSLGIHSSDDINVYFNKTMIRLNSEYHSGCTASITTEIDELLATDKASTNYIITV